MKRKACVAETGSNAPSAGFVAQDTLYTTDEKFATLTSKSTTVPPTKSAVEEVEIPESGDKNELSAESDGSLRKKARKGHEESISVRAASVFNFSVLEAHGGIIEHLSADSWVAYFPKFYKPSAEEFAEAWMQHPSNFKTIKMFGKDTLIPRYQQSYGRSYSYSGSVSESISATSLIVRLQERLNALIAGVDASLQFNMCLCNWYEPQHYIGPHSDDTRQFAHPFAPIASLSWGYARTFVLTPAVKGGKGEKSDNSFGRKEYLLQSGDLVVMGGACQTTHKHEVLKLKKSEQIEGRNRINFTFRCFK